MRQLLNTGLGISAQLPAAAKQLTGVSQEMYYRHLYATVQPTLEQRCESWDNYCALFNIILTSSINMQVSSHTAFPAELDNHQAIYEICHHCPVPSQGGKMPQMSTVDSAVHSRPSVLQQRCL